MSHFSWLYIHWPVLLCQFSGALLRFCCTYFCIWIFRSCPSWLRNSLMTSHPVRWTTCAQSVTLSNTFKLKFLYQQIMKILISWTYPETLTSKWITLVLIQRLSEQLSLAEIQLSPVSNTSANMTQSRPGKRNQDMWTTIMVINDSNIIVAYVHILLREINVWLCMLRSFLKGLQLCVVPCSQSCLCIGTYGYLTSLGCMIGTVISMLLVHKLGSYWGHGGLWSSLSIHIQS